MPAHLVEPARLCDEPGDHDLACTGHPLSDGGMTTSDSPATMNVQRGARTRRVRHGALGCVLPAPDPRRMAEGLSMLDRMTRGRAFAGFARDLRTRWPKVCGQRSPGTADDATHAGPMPAPSANSMANVPIEYPWLSTSSECPHQRALRRPDEPAATRLVPNFSSTFS